VAGKDMDRNLLIVVQGHDHPLLQSATLKAQDTSWIAGTLPLVNKNYAAKTRYRQADAACMLSANDQLIDGGKFELHFEEKQWAITPGQSAVLYDGDICLGGGIIASI
jgi:tRNA-specific 2-thiouridylase